MAYANEKWHGQNSKNNNNDDEKKNWVEEEKHFRNAQNTNCGDDFAAPKAWWYYMEKTI